MELELARTGSSTSLSGGNATRQRRHYASLDPTSMGVDVQVGPVMNLGSPDFDNNRQVVVVLVVVGCNRMDDNSGVASI